MSCKIIVNPEGSSTDKLVKTYSYVSLSASAAIRGGSAAVDVVSAGKKDSKASSLSTIS